MFFKYKPKELDSVTMDDCLGSRKDEPLRDVTTNNPE
jgi:hypothetical protein